MNIQSTGMSTNLSQFCLMIVFYTWNYELRKFGVSAASNIFCTGVSGIKHSLAQLKALMYRYVYSATSLVTH